MLFNHMYMLDDVGPCLDSRCRDVAGFPQQLADERLLRLIPLVNEGNAISEELTKGCRFSVKLLADQHQPLVVVCYALQQQAHVRLRVRRCIV